MGNKPTNIGTATGRLTNPTIVPAGENERRFMISANPAHLIQTGVTSVGNKSSDWPSHRVYAEYQPHTPRGKTGFTDTRKEEEAKHEQFALALALIAPVVTPHEWAAERNITPEVLATAAKGGYADCWAGGPNHNPNLPLVFTAPKYWLHLQPAIEAVWREVYG